MTRPHAESTTLDLVISNRLGVGQVVNFDLLLSLCSFLPRAHMILEPIEVMTSFQTIWHPPSASGEKLCKKTNARLEATFWGQFSY